ncbi:MAG TPA: Ig-like domain-containing protein [Mycobacteriales bacterium]|nr:Ig-like domain-containing protein [Mycobacteriales bacterium]
MPARSTLTRAALAVAVAAVLAGTGAVVLTSGGSPTHVQAAGPTPAPAPAAVAQVARAKGDVVPWDVPVTVTVDHGTVTSATLTGPDGALVHGSLGPAGWTSSTTLVPRATYLLHVELTNDDGATSSYDRTLHAAPPAHELRATISPRAGTYGIGQPVIVHFNHPVKGAAARTAVMQRLVVTTTPAVEGAWRWYNSYEVHYRGPSYWKPGTTVSVRADLAGLRLPGTGTWGAETARTGGMRIGAALVATVDVTAHKMTVKRNGKVVRVVNVSTGRDKYPTKGGVHIVLVREREHLYNSATVGIPTSSPDGYYEKLPWSVRISNAGAFVHANPATVRYQGSTNVSHGCVNASVRDAKWFYENSHLGDIVNVVHAAVGPVRWDAGMADWNYSWETWQKGNLTG